MLPAFEKSGLTLVVNAGALSFALHHITGKSRGKISRWRGIALRSIDPGMGKTAWLWPLCWGFDADYGPILWSLKIDS
ncbi:hypothetical protein BJF95_17300 [Rhizobium oryziradicis]|uniref:Uncharacterized protein n=1 Tax=Rhizobium oryziradicis TaxID=1867956 RepID=A0A1Q8ZSN2_9HYPH|nr:hypothetical protein BJF95_17300 [Rhizobium oryziradicis]